MAKKWTDDKIDQIRELAKTKTKKEIADIFKTSYDSIDTVSKKNGIKFSELNNTKFKWTNDKINELKDLAKTQDLTEIAVSMKLNYDTVHKACKRYNIEFIRHKQDDDEIINRESFNINKINKESKKRYFVTAVVAGTPLDKKAFETVKFYCKDKKAELVILPMRGCYKKDEGYDPDVLELSDHFVTEFTFNNNLKAKDFLLSPQQINPLTGLNRYGQKGSSLIVPSPKMQMNVVPVSNVKMPHILHTTGVITKPNYNHDRIGKIAYQDHLIGGLLVEIENNEIFHLRQLQLDDSYGMYDLGVYYQGNSKKQKHASAFIIGDWHNGFEDKSAVSCWKDCIKTVKPEYIVFHDIFDARSVSHHEENNIKAQLDRPEHLNTLEKELNCLVNMLEDWCKFTDAQLVIVKSNHDAFVDRYLSEGRYVNDRFNHRLALDLAIEYLEGKNPLEAYCLKHSKIINKKRVRWLNYDEDFKVADFQLGSHGHLGMNGSKGTLNQMETIYGKSITGHSHTPGRLRNTIKVGTSAINLGYNAGGSSWLLNSGILYDNSTYQSITSIDGKYRLK